MELLITDTPCGYPQRLRCADGRGVRLPARAVFVGAKEGLWHS
jgi:hypothetical protein